MTKTGTCQKRSSTTKDIKKEPQQVVGGMGLQQDKLEGWACNIIKSHTLPPLSGEPSSWKLRGSPTKVRILSPIWDHSSQGFSTRKRSSQSIQLWRPVGLDCRSSTELEEIKTSLVNISCTGTKGKSSKLIEAWTRPICWSWRVPWRGRRASCIPGRIHLSELSWRLTP